MSARIPEEPTVVRDLERLVGDDEALARSAFERLWATTRPALMRRLGRFEVHGEDAEDQAQRAASYLWRHRKAFRARSSGEWYALARRALRRCLASEWGSRARARAAESMPDVPEGDLPYLDAFVAAADEVGRVYAAADLLWLGEARCDRPEVAAAAVQQVLLEGVSEAEAAAMFGVDRSEISAWLEDHGVLSRVLYSSLCWPGDALAGYVLRPERPLADDELDTVLETVPPDAWTGPEARVVVWRARNGLREDEIAAQAGDTLDSAAIVHVLDRYRAAIPFRAMARALLRSLERRGIALETSRTGLWRRIVFEYAAVQELPHLQIVERAGAPAQEAGARIDMPTLNNWLSMRRLYAQLAARLLEEAP